MRGVRVARAADGGDDDEESEAAVLRSVIQTALATAGQPRAPPAADADDGEDEEDDAREWASSLALLLSAAVRAADQLPWTLVTCLRSDAPHPLAGDVPGAPAIELACLDGLALPSRALPAALAAFGLSAVAAASARRGERMPRRLSLSDNALGPSLPSARALRASCVGSGALERVVALDLCDNELSALPDDLGDAVPQLEVIHFKSSRNAGRRGCHPFDRQSSARAFG